MNSRLFRHGQFVIWFMALAMTALLVVRLSWVAKAAAIDGDIWWNEIYHDSRDPLYRNPGGSVPINTDVTLRLRTAANDLTSAQIRLWNSVLGVQTIPNMTKVATDGTFDWWQATINTGGSPNVLYYRFILTDSPKVDFYEDDDRFWGGVGQMYEDSDDRSWALTVHDPAFQTPDWVKNAVFYQVFVDRFRNGDASNDNGFGEFFYNEAPGTIVRSSIDTVGEVLGDWNDPVCDPRLATGDACQGSYSRNFYGGDLQGLINKLDYLEDLGVTALYLNPIFESPSNHKYDTSDFSVIDDNFGTLTDFTALIAEADNRGIKVVLDGVFNHASSMGPYFDRYGVHPNDGACESLTSPYEPMFQFFTDTESPTCSDNRDYPYWFGIFDSLAVLDNTSTTGAMARDAVWGAGITHPSGVSAAVGKYWIDQGAAGWRLDVAPEVDHGMFEAGNDYWENFRAAVHSVDPNAYIAGEEWGLALDWTLGGTQGSVTFPDGNPGEWDATMNYQQSAALLSFWRDTALLAENDFNPGSSAGQLAPLSPSLFVERYSNLKERYSPEAFAAMMNLLGSHDTQRALWLLDHGHPASPTAGTRYPASASHDWSDAMKRLQGVALMQFTLPGAPQIYYGDEIGLVGQATFDGSSWQDDPYNRQPYPWLDEAGTPFFPHLQADGARDDLHEYYATLTNARNTYASLRTGSIEFLLADDEANTLSYLRQAPDYNGNAVILINRGASAANVTVNVAGKVPNGAMFDDLLTPTVETYSVAFGGELTGPSLAPNTGALLVQTSASPPPPNAPTNLVATVNNLNIDLTWDAVAGTNVYKVYRSLMSGGGYVHLEDVPFPPFTDTTAAPGVRYYYRVTAEDIFSGLISAPSNEDDARTEYDLASAYRNVQWPPSLTHMLSTETPTDTVYGQLYIGGVTDALNDSPAPGITAQVGYGPDGSNPSVNDSGWTFFPMIPNPGYNWGQNNDEYQGSLLPTAVGSFVYTTRYSSDGGETWHYASDCVGDPDGLCPLTVVASSDTTAPSAPTLVKEFDVETEVGLSWSDATDDVAIGKYRVFRSDAGAMSYTLLAELDDAVTSYVDNTVATGSSYDYVVRAVDTGFNESADSNVVTALAENSMVDVTFVVTVPPFTTPTDDIYATGSVSQLGDWNDGAVLSPTGNPNEYSVTLSFDETSSFEYKYRRAALWEKVEKAADGYVEVPNRQYTVGHAEDGPFTITDTVANWRDVLVTETLPEDNATDVPVYTTVAVFFNKTVDTGSTFVVRDASDNPVSGTFSVTNGVPTVVSFIPDNQLCFSQTYTVNVANISADGDGFQFDPYSFDFTTQVGVSYRSVTFITTVPSFTPADGTVYLSGNVAELGDNDPTAALPMIYDADNGVWTLTVDLPTCTDITLFHHRGSLATVETDAASGETPATHTINIPNGVFPDMDFDGLPDEWEILWFGNLDQIATSDPDNDGCNNGCEYAYGTDPTNLDTDDDGLDDWDEIYVYSTNPLHPDTDADGATDYDELFVCFTDPLDPDTDDDGLLDGEECDQENGIENLGLYGSGRLRVPNVLPRTSDSSDVTIELTVGHWEDPIVTAVSPPDDATDVPADTTIAVTFSKAIQSDSTFEVTDPDSAAVLGLFAYDSETRTLTFTPTDPLDYDTEYTVTVSGVEGADSSAQVADSVTLFTTAQQIIEPIAVTWTVTIPEFTPSDTIYISGNHPQLGDDALDAVAMTNSGPNTWTFTADFLEGTELTYTFTRGSANTQATEADGEALFSETVTVDGGGGAAQQVSDTIANWLDPIVIATTPVDGAAQQPVNTPVSVQFSKSIDPTSTFSVVNSDMVAETGTFSYDEPTRTLTLTPNPNFRYADTITVTVTGVQGAVSGVQEGSFVFDFTTPYLELLDNGDFEADPANKVLLPWEIVNGTKEKLKCLDTPRAFETVSGLCAFRFKGSIGEKSKLQQTVDLTSVTFQFGNELILSAFLDSGSAVNLKIKLKVKYVSGVTDKQSLAVTPTNGYDLFTVPTLVLNDPAVEKIEVLFKHKSLSSKSFLDDASLKLRQGDARRAKGGSEVLPLPGGAGSEWRGF